MNKRHRLVVSITTVPSRLNTQRMRDVIYSIATQTLKPDVIYLSLPSWSRRLKKRYPEPDEWIRKYCKIVNVPDYGPITKLAGAILSEQDPETIIITCDDDIICQPNKLENVYNKCIKHPNAAICSYGFIIGQFPFMGTFVRDDDKFPSLYTIQCLQYKETLVDVLFGYRTAAYRRKFFPYNEALIDQFLSRPLQDEDVFLNDDVYISAYLNNNNIQIFAYDTPGVINDTAVDAISSDMKTFVLRFIRSIYRCYQWGMWKNDFVQLPLKDKIQHSLGTWIIFGIILIMISLWIIRLRPGIDLK